MMFALLTWIVKLCLSFHLLQTQCLGEHAGYMIEVFTHLFPPSFTGLIERKCQWGHPVCDYNQRTPYSFSSINRFAVGMVFPAMNIMHPFYTAIYIYIS